MDIKININEKVKVRVTKVGMHILEEEHISLYDGCKKTPDFKSPKVDGDGYSEWQLWDLMATFGKHMTPSGNVPFETQIIL